MCFNFVPINEDTDDDNDGVIDEDDIDSLDKCVSTDSDGDGLVDDVAAFGYSKKLWMLSIDYFQVENADSI